ncbi:hypothetical protein AC579_7111 [Pseudocercospora musae]|uniref:WSC domain-containing protein n=1 Tax=Pseudocercospora musae TaxID=113226 RepID=A0A139IMH7_9PEZI|nr:hypothetical protein AC579_7111 [Pseudocercospora musae]
MPSLATRTLTLLSLFGTMALASEPILQKGPPLQKRAQSYKGCYSSSADMSNVGSYTYQSTGYCGEKCTGQSQAVMGLSAGDECWCGGNIPADSDKVDDSKCNSPCTGYGQDDCGGDGFWSVYTTGTGTAGTEGASSASSDSSSTKGTPSTSAVATVSTSIAPGHTVVVTIAPDTSSTSIASPDKSGGGGTNTTGIAVGVVVGVVAVAGIIGALVFWRKRKNAREAEEEYARKNQANDFIRGGGERKPPGTGYSGMSDQRLDPEAGRRNSVGSLADNQDYSRRILRIPTRGRKHRSDLIYTQREEAKGNGFEYETSPHTSDRAAPPHNDARGINSPDSSTVSQLDLGSGDFSGRASHFSKALPQLAI